MRRSRFSEEQIAYRATAGGARDAGRGALPQDGRVHEVVTAFTEMAPAGLEPTALGPSSSPSGDENDLAVGSGGHHLSMGPRSIL
jgi:hypothetical protein